MNHISDNGGKFIIIPATRSEKSWFQEYLKDHGMGSGGTLSHRGIIPVFYF